MAWPPASPSTWSVKHNFGVGSDDLTEILYVADDEIYTRGTHIHVYDSTTGGRVQIGTNASDFETTAQTAMELAYFKSNLYSWHRRISSPADWHTRAYRYDGTPNSWSRVWDDNASAVQALGGFGGDLNNCIVAIYDDSGTDRLQVSSTGNLGSFSNATFSPSITFANVGEINGRNNNDGDTLFVRITTSGGTYYVYKLESDGTLSRVGNAIGFVDYRRTPGYHWRFNSPNWQYSTDCITWNTPSTTPTVEPMVVQNYTKTFGILGDQIYFWDDSTNDWSTTVDTAPSPQDFDSHYIAVLSDGTPIVGGTFGTSRYSLQRDDPLDTDFLPDGGGGGGGGGNGRFYFGLGTLQEKFTIPFNGVKPKSMTLDKSLGTVVMGANEAAIEPIIYSQHPYPTGTVSADGFPTNVPINVLKWI